MATFSIIICTLGRSRSYEELKESLYKQSNQDYEIIKVTEEGPLAKIRNEGARKARGQYLCFVDDDVVCSPYWLEALWVPSDEAIRAVQGLRSSRNTLEKTETVSGSLLEYSQSIPLVNYLHGDNGVSKQRKKSVTTMEKLIILKLATWLLKRRPSGK